MQDSLGINEVEFAVFCIENVAKKLGVDGKAAYTLLTQEQAILDEYIIPNYEILHTQSKEYIVNDIIEYMHECGVLEKTEAIKRLRYEKPNLQMCIRNQILIDKYLKYVESEEI